MRRLLPLGWLCAALMILGTLVLGYLLPDYNLVTNTISEIGEIGTPFYYQYKVLDTLGAVLILLFAVGTYLFSTKQKLSTVPAIFLICFAMSNVGASFFPTPHPLHNVFGLSTTIGYFTPLMVYRSWKDTFGVYFKRISMIFFIWVLVTIFLNLSPLFTRSLYPMEYYGLVQRSLVYPFYLYCAYVSIRLSIYDNEKTKSTAL